MGVNDYLDKYVGYHVEVKLNNGQVKNGTLKSVFDTLLRLETQRWTYSGSEMFTKSPYEINIQTADIDKVNIYDKVSIVCQYRIDEGGQSD